MADPKSIHEFTSGEGALGSLFLMDSPDQQASSGYTTEKLAMTDLGDFLNNEMEYTQDLDTEDKKISGALNELHGVDGFDVYDETTTSANKYEQGDICIHNNTLQVCTDAAGAYGAWDSSKWSPTTIKAILASKQDALTMGAEVTISNSNPYITYRIYGKLLFLYVNMQNKAVTTDETLANLPAECTPLMGNRAYRGNGLLAYDGENNNRLWARSLDSWTTVTMVLPLQ